MNLHELLKYSAEMAREHTEYIRNEDFNNRLDDGEIEEHELVLRKPGGEEQPLSPLSAALYVTDLPTYRQLLRDDFKSLKQSILNIEEFPNNSGAYDRLLSIVRNKATVIPFVGAGFSVAAGCPSWSDYIYDRAIHVKMDHEIVSEMLRNGEHEQLMDKVVETLSIPVFLRDFQVHFEGGRITPSLSPATELLGLFDGCAITTNFDRVLENSLKEERPYDEKVEGKDDTGRFLKALFRRERYLLKLHGNIDNPRNRILTKQEYDEAYGHEVIQHDLPVPRTLFKVFEGFSVLFLGCSLTADRYLNVLKSVYDAGENLMPDHFAILPAPGDIDELFVRDQFLAQHGITPIWFTKGDWDKPAEILRLLRTEQ